MRKTVEVEVDLEDLNGVVDFNNIELFEKMLDDKSFIKEFIYHLKEELN